MIKNNKAESMIGIIVGVIILSFLLTGIINIISFNKDYYSIYEEFLYENILKGSSSNIIKKLDISNISDNEIFYLNKDTITKNFTLYTGSSNEEYAYINNLGLKTNSGENIGKTYKREFLNKIDILRYNLNPSYLSGVIFHFDATNIDGSYNSTLNANDPVSTWKDLINNYDGLQNGIGLEPLYITGGINSFPYVKFDGSNDVLNISNNSDINTQAGGYQEKSFAIVLKTGDNVISNQTIYEQGGGSEGYLININSSDISARVWNSTWDKTVSLGEALINNIYLIIIIQDSINNKLQIYLNGELVNEQTGLSSSQIAHSGDITIGSNGYKGGIGELISWNYALTENEIRGIHIYFTEKWLRGKQDVIHYVNEIKVNKIKNY